MSESLHRNIWDIPPPHILFGGAGAPLFLHHTTDVVHPVHSAYKPVQSGTVLPQPAMGPKAAYWVIEIPVSYILIFW